jgi:predicted methyltransferase
MTYFFHFHCIDQIFNAHKNGEKKVCVSLDLNLSEQTYSITDSHLLLSDDISIELTRLEGIRLIKNRIFIFKDNVLSPLEIRSDGYYKLVPTNSLPTLEINGIKMHRSKDIDPETDAELKTQLVVSLGDVVLDTCGGLGYSALFALKAGARHVISTEKSKAVIELRNLNPWIARAETSHIQLIHTDITREIEKFDDTSFNSIIHDPPRFTSSTGDLYGLAFYKQLFRVMTSRSKLFHYTGSPKKIKNEDKFIKNAIKRLVKAGFNDVCFHDNLQGIYAKKN